MTVIAAQRDTPAETELQQHTGVVSVPDDGLRGLQKNWKTDILSGFIVFVIALPLSLGIAMASGVPPAAGIVSAIVGGMVVSLLSGSHMTINGPAAGLIVVVLYSVDSLGGGVAGYRGTLAAIVISGFILVALGILRAGGLAKIFPAAVVHGMLAAIGIIIMTKQLPYMLGVTPVGKEPVALIMSVPAMVVQTNPAVAATGFFSLFLLLVHSCSKNAFIRKTPAPVIVIVLATILSCCLGLDRVHDYNCLGRTYHIEPVKCLVALPKNVTDGMTMPDFAALNNHSFWLCVLSITIIQGVESLLSSSAVSRLDPFRRQGHLSRDIVAVGCGSMISGLLGGLPIISEIVRSTANVANGARTRWSNFFHGLFMLLALLFCSDLINKMPLSALAAILLVTGYRLASPRVFKEMHAVGIDQTIIFATTAIATLSTDLLVGVSLGIATKTILHIARGASVTGLFRARIESQVRSDGSIDLVADGVLVFSNYLSLKKTLDKLPQGKMVRLDLSAVRLIDHSVMEHLQHFCQDFAEQGGSLKIIGLERHQRSAKHPFASARLRIPAWD